VRISFFGLQQAFDYRHIGGSESITRRLAKQLSQDDDIEAVDYVYFGAPRTETQRVMTRTSVRYFSAFADAARALLGYDHVVSLYLTPRTRIPYIAFRTRQRDRIQFHALVTQWRGAPLKRLLWLADLQLVPPNGAVFAISPRLLALVKRWARRPFLMLPPVPDDWFLRVSDKPIHSLLRVTYVGRVDPGKGAAEAVELFYRLKNDKRFSCRFLGYLYEPGRVSGTEEELYRLLKALPAGTFVESNYTTYSPQLDQIARNAMAETDVLLLPYRDVSSTADMPLVFMEGMASLCALVIPQSAADLPQVYGPSPFYIRGEDWVKCITEILASAGDWLEEERQRSEERNARLNFGAAAAAKAFKRVLLGKERPRVEPWPRNLLTFQESSRAGQ
jgi:glycosyltransferase involved in cell wall biosynthesis